MNISEIKAGTGKVNLENVKVIEVGAVREFEKFGKKGRVATAKIEDESGQIELTLWNEQIDLIKAGSIISLIDGYASEFKGKVQVTPGRTGRIEVKS